MKKVGIICIIFFNISISAKEINVAYGEHNSAPHIVRGPEGEVRGGILSDIAHAIGRELGLDVKLFETPRSRIEGMIKLGVIDIYCNSKKVWVKSPDDYYWYENITKDSNLLYVNSANSKKINSIEDIDSPIGTIKGFVYHPRIEKLIKRVGKYELNTHKNLIEFLKLNRAAVIISSKNILESLYHKKNEYPKAIEDFQNEFSYDCIISKSINFDKDELIKALSKFKASRDEKLPVGIQE